MAIENQKTPWADAIVLICEKCGKSLEGLKLKEHGNAAENLKKHLKSQMKEQGLGKNIRVINSGCLDVCLKNKVAISYIPNQSEHKPQLNLQRTFTVHPEEDREEVLNFLLSTLKK